jgi:sugar lactone lactonase YvrE
MISADAHGSRVMVMLRKKRAAALLGTVAALAAQGCTPESSKPQPVHSSSPGTSQASATPSGGLDSRPAPAASPSKDVAIVPSVLKGPNGVAVDAMGNVYVANTGSHTIVEVTSDGVLTTLAGAPGERGSADGSGSAARFYYPHALALDAAGNIYVADEGNDTIRKVSPAGAVTTLAGLPGVAGDSDGAGRAMRFRSPSAIAVDEAGNVYVGDSGNYTLRKITSAGIGTTLAGRAGRGDITDGTRSGARFTAILGITLDSAGNVYTTEIDKLKGVAIRRVTPKGVVTTLSRARGPEGADAALTGFVADFNVIHGIAVDAGGNIYVSDAGNVVWKVTPTGVATIFAGSRESGHKDGQGSEARFNSPRGLAVDRTGKVYVADSGNNSIRIISPEGAVTTLTVKQGGAAPTPESASSAVRH